MQQHPPEPRGEPRVRTYPFHSLAVEYAVKVEHRDLGDWRHGSCTRERQPRHSLQWRSRWHCDVQPAFLSRISSAPLMILISSSDSISRLVCVGSSQPATPCIPTSSFSSTLRRARTRTQFVTNTTRLAISIVDSRYLHADSESNGFHQGCRRESCSVARRSQRTRQSRSKRA